MAALRVQAKAATSGTAAVTTTFDSTPTTGNRLFSFVCAASASSTISLDGSGWTVVKKYDAVSSIAIYSKIAGASEPTAVVVSATGSGVTSQVLAEYSGLAAQGTGVGPLDHFAERDTTSGTGSSWRTGTIIGTRTADQVWIGVVGTSSSLTTTPSVDNSFSLLPNAGRILVADKIVTAVGDATATFSWGSTTPARKLGAMFAYSTTQLPPQYSGWGQPI